MLDAGCWMLDPPPSRRAHRSHRSALTRVRRACRPRATTERAGRCQAPSKSHRSTMSTHLRRCLAPTWRSETGGWLPREARRGYGRVEIGFSTRTSHCGAAVSAAVRALDSWRDVQPGRLRHNVAPILSVRCPRLPPLTIFGIPRGRTSRGPTTRNCQKWHARSARPSRSLRAVWGVQRVTCNV